jgi:hypothetical protein
MALDLVPHPYGAYPLVAEAVSGTAKQAAQMRITERLVVFFIIELFLGGILLTSTTMDPSANRLAKTGPSAGERVGCREDSPFCSSDGVASWLQPLFVALKIHVYF